MNQLRLAGDFPYGNEFTTAPSTDLTDPLQNVVIEQQAQNDSFVEQILDTFGFNVGSVGGGTAPDSALSYIQYLFNIALGLLAMISVIILIYNFFMIFFSKEKEGVENAQKAVKRVAIVILIMGLSRLIVSFLFWVVAQFVN
ncbi:MAG: hypothetical protein WC004_01445 [Candidatus Absconditabacterales bacterium]